MENITVDIDLCTSLLSNMSNKSNGKTGYDVILEIIMEMTTNRGDSLSSFGPDIVTSILGISYFIMKLFVETITSMGFGLSTFFILILALYYGYKVLIKPFNYIQDLNLPGETEKRRDMINLRRRLRRMGTKLPPPYPNGWFALLESAELKVGEVKQVDCIGENFAVFRTLDGEVHVTNAYCPHLGASLAVGGTIQGDCIECPFHKWRFNSTSGKCVSIPNIETVPRGLGLKVWTSIEIDEAIFVWYDKEGRSPDWQLPFVDEVKKGDWIYHARNEFLVSSHIQDIPENGADVAHLNAIHSDHLMAGKSLPTTDCWNALGLHEWDGKWESTDIPHEARVSINHEVKLFNRFTVIKFHVEARQVGASYVQLKLSHRFGRVVFLQTVTPLEPLLQKVVHRLYAPWYIRPLANFMMWGETVMFHRDVMIWNKKQFINNPQLVKTDKCIKAFRNWFQQFYTENSITFKDAILGPKKDLIDW